MAARRCRWRAMRRLMLSSPGSGPEDGGGAAVARYVTGACLTATCSANRLFPERIPPTISVRWAMNEPSSLASSPAHRPEGNRDFKQNPKSEYRNPKQIQSTNTENEDTRNIEIRNKSKARTQKTKTLGARASRPLPSRQDAGETPALQGLFS